MEETTNELLTESHLEELSAYKINLQLYSKDALLLESVRITDSIAWIDRPPGTPQLQYREGLPTILAIWHAKLKIVSDLLAEKELLV